MVYMSSDKKKNMTNAMYNSRYYFQLKIRWNFVYFEISTIFKLLKYLVKISNNGCACWDLGGGGFIGLLDSKSISISHLYAIHLIWPLYKLIAQIIELLIFYLAELTSGTFFLEALILAQVATWGLTLVY